MTGDPLNLDQATEWTGQWWLPGNQDERMPGILRYDGEGNLSLSLIGAFEDRITSTPAPGITVYHEGARTWDIIHGVAENREITLLDCTTAGSKRVNGSRVNSPDTQTVTAGMAVIGAHISGQDEAAFATAEISVEDMRLWAASSVFESSIGISEDKIDGTGALSAKPVENQSAIVDDTEYCLKHTHTLPYLDERKGGTIGRMRDTVSIRVRRGKPITLSDALETANLIQDLISLATHRSAGIIWLQLEAAGSESVVPNGQTTSNQRAGVLYSPVAIGKRDEKAVDFHRVFFTCKTLPFEVVMPRWCEVHDRLQAATNMVLGLRYAPAQFIENNLLTAVGAAEVLHRGLNIADTPFNDEEFKQIREAMLSQAPEKYRGRFKAAIRNDPTLRDRLQALVTRPDQEAIARLIPDVGYWASRTVKARNNLAHEGRTPQQSIDELIAIVGATTAVVVLNILQELGLPPERQREIVREHPQFMRVFKEASEWLMSPDTNSQ